MRYLVQELGPEAFRAEVSRRAGFVLRPAGEELTRRYRGDHIGVHSQRQPGLCYVGCSVTVGRISGEDLVEAARLAEAYGDGEVRLATDQNFVLTGVANQRIEDLVQEGLLQRHSPFPAPFERGAVACTGSEFCRFAIVETKARAVKWAKAMDSRYGDRFSGVNGSEAIIRMHFSGCPASSAQPQIADIGFRGETAHVGDEIVEAVDIGLGGSLGVDAAFGDWVDGAVPVSEVVEALGRAVDRFFTEAVPGERFHEWARRVPMAALRSSLRGEMSLQACPSADGRWQEEEPAP